MYVYPYNSVSLPEVVRSPFTPLHYLSTSAVQNCLCTPHSKDTHIPVGVIPLPPYVLWRFSTICLNLCKNSVFPTQIFVYFITSFFRTRDNKILVVLSAIAPNNRSTIAIALLKHSNADKIRSTGATLEKSDPWRKPLHVSCNGWGNNLNISNRFWRLWFH